MKISFRLFKKLIFPASIFIVIFWGVFSITKFPHPHSKAHPDLQLYEFTEEYNSTDKPEIFEIHNTYHSYSQSNRFVSQDVWRPHDLYKNIPLADYTSKLRPKAPIPQHFKNTAHYLRQPLVADYPPNADKIFLMIKTGSTVLWERLPIHLMTTLTKVPYYGLYSDAPSSIAGHEVIDILANVTAETKKHDDFKLYQKLQKLRSRHSMLNPRKEDLGGGWELDKYKNIPMLAHALKAAPKSVDWFVFIDADTYLLIENMIGYLMRLDAKDKLYLGSVVNGGKYAFGHGGSGVAISRAALEASLGKHPEWEHAFEKETIRNCCGDSMVASLLGEAGIYISPEVTHKYPYVGKRFQGEPLYSLEGTDETWCQQVFTFHHIKPFEVELLWEYERLIGPQRRKFITYYDIYRDFHLPYIKPIKPDWNNLAKTRSFSKRKDLGLKEKGEDESEEREEIEEKLLQSQDDGKYTHRPWYSRANCEYECNKWQKCLSWRYIPGEKYCGLSSSIKFGHPYIKDMHINYLGEENDWDLTNITSGFIIARIREMRKKQKCDVFYHYNQYPDTVKNTDYEGWYINMEEQDEDRLKSLYEGF